jgi:hypothetical protein
LDGFGTPNLEVHLQLQSGLSQFLIQILFNSLVAFLKFELQIFLDLVHLLVDSVLEGQQLVVNLPFELLLVLPLLVLEDGKRLHLRLKAGVQAQAEPLHKLESLRLLHKGLLQTWRDVFPFLSLGRRFLQQLVYFGLQGARSDLAVGKYAFLGG